MHKAVKKAIDCFNRGDRPEADQAYSQIESYSNEVVHYLDELLKKI